jgi:hypothetical protein
MCQILAKASTSAAKIHEPVFLLPQMHAFDYNPQPYTGPLADETLKKRKQFLGPYNFYFYDKLSDIVEGAGHRSLECREEPKDSGEPAQRNVRTSVKVSNPAGGHSNIIFSQEISVKTSKRAHGQKVAELIGNNIFKEDHPTNSTEKPLSIAYSREAWLETVS